MASVLTKKAVVPTEEALTAVLKESKAFWDGIKGYIAANYKKPNEEWKFYGTKSGWTLAVLSDKRRLVNMIPQQGYFQVIFTLSEKAAAAVRNSDLPESTKAAIPDATQCVCGYGLVLDVKTAADLDAAKKLIEIKDKN